MGSPSRNVQYHPPRLSEDRLNLAQPHSPSLPTHCSGKSGMRPLSLEFGQTYARIPIEKRPTSATPTPWRSIEPTCWGRTSARTCSVIRCSPSRVPVVRTAGAGAARRRPRRQRRNARLRDRMVHPCRGTTCGGRSRPARISPDWLAGTADHPERKAAAPAERDPRRFRAAPVGDAHGLNAGRDGADDERLHVLRRRGVQCILLLPGFANRANRPGISERDGGRRGD